MPDSAFRTLVIKHLLSVVSFGCLKKGDLISIALNTAGVPLYFKLDDVQPDPVSVTVDEVIWKFSLFGPGLRRPYSPYFGWPQA